MEQNKCNKCGRPMNYATEPKCNYCDACMNEYCGCKLGRIKEIEPTCDSTAVIPSITVQSVEGITNLANCLVHVEDINTTFYVDDKHRVMITWAGPVDIPGYNMVSNPSHYKDQIVTDIEKGIAVIYDKHGNGYTFGIYDSLDSDGAVTQAINDKLDEMATDGTLEDIIASYLEDAILGFDTVADMKASTDLADGSYVRTLGYYAKDDMGGAYYKISSTTPSGYYETLASGLYAELIIEDTMNVKQFGAKGDGVADDTASIQTAINYGVSKGIHLNCVGKFLITNSISVPNGIVYLDGFPNGAYGASSVFIVKNDTENVIPAFVFSNAMSGSIIKNITINYYNSNYNHLFDGIVIDRSEHCYFSDIYVRHARYGIYFRCNTGSVYCTSFEHCSTQHCDIGINIPTTPSWNGAVSFRDCFEISDNRIGFNIEEANLLTIAGGATEIGRNSDIGIKISGGSVNLCEGIYIENNTNSDISVSGGSCYINGSLICTKQPKISGDGKIFQNVAVAVQNVPAPKKFSKNDLALYLSFDNFGSSTVTDYANNITLDNSSFQPVKEGVYGDSSFIKDEFGKGVIKDHWNLSGDWTLLMCMKDYSDGEALQNMMVRLLESNTSYYQILFTSLATNRNLLRITGTNIPGFTAFNLSATDYKNYDWVILEYDSTNKRITSYYRTGNVVASNPSGSVDFSNVTDVYFRMIENMKLKADEIIVYNRLLDYNEIQTITDLPYRPTNLT